MQLKESLLKHKKGAVAALAAATAGVLVLCAFTSAGGSGESAAETGAVYRESTVERGDITVGVTETATATLKTHALSFEVGAELEEIFVKAGQAVKEGDPIASISTASMLEEIDSLRADYQEAALKLSEAQLSRQEGELTAKSKYNSTLSDADSADSTYEIAVEKLEATVAEAEREIAELEEKQEELARLLKNIDAYDSHYDSYSTAKQTYENAKSKVTSLESDIDTYKWENGEYYREQDDYQDLLNDLEYAKTLYNRAEAYFKMAEESFQESFDEQYPDEESIVDAQEETQRSLEEKQLALKEARYALETNDAERSREETVEKASLADTTYSMELQSLANSVASKQLALDNIQTQIDKYAAYLEKTLIAAPCDGIVTAVSFDAGDEVQAGTTVATVSDSGNVFVYISVSQDDITSVTLGQSASVEMDAFEALAFAGTVDSITTTPVRSASGSASYNVTIRLEGDTAQVYEGMTGSATLITRQQKDVLYVTNRTIFEKDGQSYVKVKSEDGAVEEVPVTTGFSDGRNVEITEGLAEGQTVLIESQVAVQS